MSSVESRSNLPGNPAYTPRQVLAIVKRAQAALLTSNKQVSVVAPLHLVTSRSPLDGWRGYRGMNSEATTYTPLECLLLFQSLVTYGTEDSSFVKISDLLTDNSLVKNAENYDAGRLSWNALRDLYLQLLRDELKAEEDGQEDSSQPEPKKRKVPGSALPTTKDAEVHKDKLPVLVERLYVRYMVSMIAAIKEDERRYALLQEEVEEIDRGEWDERILKEDKAMANKNGSVSPQTSRPKVIVASASPLPEKAVDSPVPHLSHEEAAEPPSSIELLQNDTRPEGLAINDVLNSRESTRTSSPQVSESKPKSGTAPATQSEPSSNGPQRPLPSPQPPSIQQGHPPAPVPQSGMAFKWEPPYGPPHHPQPYQHGGQYSPQFNLQQYPPQSYPPPARGPFTSPHGLPHPHLPSSPLSMQHPHQVLPPNTGNRSPGSPHGMQLDAASDAGGQQYRATSGSPLMQAPPYISQHRPQSGSGLPPWNSPYMQQYQGSAHQGPPHQVAPQQYPLPQSQIQRPYPPRPDLVPPENRQYTSPYNMSQGPKTSTVQGMQRAQPNPNTPISQGPPRFLTGSGTKWTPNPTASTPRMFTVVDRPAVEPLSPVLRPTKPLSSNKPAKKQALKSDRKPKKVERRGLQRTRAGSSASSVMAGSYRSQSVMSHVDELSQDKSVKEEAATPLALPPGLEDETGDTTADESLPNTRIRPPNIGASPSRLKRKRNDSIIETPHESTNPATHVLWTRAFPKISASALESVTGHRNASMFATPVKERDARGYKDLILRPQDLKTIKSAINAGHRAATAVVPDDTPAAQSSVWLPISEDLIPPKGIINYAQLEKELMRMFANAVMFNADPDRGLGALWEEMRGRGKKGGEGYEIDEDGFVKDTRAMYADVEKIIGTLKSTKRLTEEMMSVSGTGSGNAVRGSSTGVRGSSVMGEVEDDVDELANDADATTGTVAKRRRRG